MRRVAEWVIGFLALLACAGIIFAVTTAHGAPARPVQLWTLWQVDESYTPVKAIYRFTAQEACVTGSWRWAFLTGDLVQCYPYTIGDFNR